MASYYDQNSMILTLLISLLSLIAFTHAVDNGVLVNKMCGATYAPKVCLSCLMSDCRHSKIDVDVIQQMLGCLVNDAKKLEEDVNKIVKDGKIDSNTRDAVLTVSANIGAIINAGAKADEQVGKKKLNDARSLIRNVIIKNLRTINFAISKAVSKDGITIPPPIFSGIFFIEADHKISDQLIASVKV